MEIAAKKLINFLLIFGVFSFLAVGTFGMEQFFGMQMNDDGTMSGCLFDGKAKICNMTFSDHLSRWKGMFTAITQKANLFILLFLLISSVGALLLFNARRRLLLLLFSRFSNRWRLYIRHNPELSLFNPLREAFSQGILNPKIY